MATAARGQQAPQLTIADAFGTLLDSFMVHLEAVNASAATRTSYRATAAQFRTWLEEHGRPTDPEAITRKDVEGFVSHLLKTRSEGTARTRFQALHRYFNWLV
ncbi:MAG TPA: phage integrase N-terminal SAM-like domain-containing protein, partial [Candidatus Dormibacteraeota bacterium]|nr:phage integrase N-terminal SAM-like domain-containing protein [Candidatus Dormibacteraeota bacterium]